MGSYSTDRGISIIGIRDFAGYPAGVCGISRGRLRDIPREIAGYPSGGLPCPAYRVAKKLGGVSEGRCIDAQLFEFAGRLVGGSPSARCDWRARTPRGESAPGSLPAPPPLLATCGFYGDAAWERPAPTLREKSKKLEWRFGTSMLNVVQVTAAPALRISHQSSGLRERISYRGISR
ncbi:hypothetical protein Bbelb_316070 [Branchiostoma belcheri]|nr:hypothetical protein Bbelb_316070 [Branchiostoma belcheri]